MADSNAIQPDTGTDVHESVQQVADDWTSQRQFGMTFAEQQEVLYTTLLAYTESD